MQELTIRKETNFICMITEPSVIRHRLSGIPRHYNSIPATKDNSPRAAIFTSPSIPIQEISNLSHRDLTVGLIKCGNKQTAIISAYMDIKSKPITDQLQAALDYCKSRGYSILLTADTNCRNRCPAFCQHRLDSLTHHRCWTSHHSHPEALRRRSQSTRSFQD